MRKEDMVKIVMALVDEKISKEDTVKLLMGMMVEDERDSIEVGDSKRGKFKVYGDLEKPEAFQKKIDVAVKMARSANASLTIVD